MCVAKSRAAIPMAMQDKQTLVVNEERVQLPTPSQCREMIEKVKVFYVCLTHWGRVTHICVGKLTIIGSDNGLSPDRRQAIIGTNAGILLIGPLGTDFSEILIEILTFSFKKMRLKVSSANRRPSCLGLNVLNKFSTYRANTVYP